MDFLSEVFGRIKVLYKSIGTVNGQEAHAPAVYVVNASAGGGGDASADNQLLEIAATQQVRDRLPTSLLAARLSVAVLGTPVLYAEGSATSAVSAATALGTTATMVSLQAEGAGIAFGFGASGAAAQTAAQSTTARIRIPAGASRDFMVPAGMTHLAWIRTGTSDGVASIVGLV